MNEVSNHGPRRQLLAQGARAQLQMWWTEATMAAVKGQAETEAAP